MTKKVEKKVAKVSVDPRTKAKRTGPTPPLEQKITKVHQTFEKILGSRLKNVDIRELVEVIEPNAEFHAEWFEPGLLYGIVSLLSDSVAYSYEVYGLPDSVIEAKKKAKAKAK